MCVCGGERGEGGEGAGDAKDTTRLVRQSEAVEHISIKAQPECDQSKQID